MDANPDRIIVERLHGHWSAWWEHTPQIAFGGADPRKQWIGEWDSSTRALC